MNSSPTQRREDKGFTLIELMVVVLIIAILLAIAIPTFLGAQNKAKDRSAQSSVRNALTNAKTIFADTGKYSDVNIDKLAASGSVRRPSHSECARTGVTTCRSTQRLQARSPMRYTLLCP
jgi:prepilin-type N-terminal cleavage/methylation domain-containing protein